jgi:2-polyprenyl-3-methyl-5-hydroxy-6-metoxy-1,4-benzoquinol methylase
MIDRKSHWERVYGSKAPQAVSWYQQEPALSLRLIANAGLSPDAPLIDVGGGASVLVDRLCEQGHDNVAVLDFSETALEVARNRLAEKAVAVDWYVEDVTEFRPPHRFSLWHDRAVFHFLTEAGDREKYINVLKLALEPAGQVIIMTFAIDGPAKCSGLDVVQYDADKLTAEMGTGFELLESGHDIHLTPAGGQQKFAYFRLLANPGAC